MKRGLGMILLAIYLILVGLVNLVPGMTIPYSQILLGLLALVAGILILIGR